MMNDPSCLFVWVPLLIMLLGGLWQRNNEIKIWNNGVCRQTGEKWVYFDSTSQGCRGYKSGDYCCWITYSVDK